jgi:hypothetical protein
MSTNSLTPRRLIPILRSLPFPASMKVKQTTRKSRNSHKSGPTIHLQKEPEQDPRPRSRPPA